MQLVAGFRPIRLLGEGKRASVWLSKFELEENSKELLSSFGGQVPPLVALKMFRSDVAGAEIRNEIECLSRVSNRHVLRMLDLSTDEKDRPILVLDLLSSHSLTDLLRSRKLRLGEAVTVLAPLITAVKAMHSSGVVHNSISPNAVHFDASGAPVLARFGSAFPLESSGLDLKKDFSIARLASEPSVKSDLQCLLSLCELVIGESDLLSSHIATLNNCDDTLNWLDHLSSLVFSVAEAEPIGFVQQRNQINQGVPSRISVKAPVFEETAQVSLSGDAIEIGSNQSSDRRHGFTQLVSKVIHSLGPIKARLKSRWFKPKILIVAIVGIVALIANFLLTSGSKESAKASKELTSGTNSDVVFELSDAQNRALTGADPLIAAKTLLSIRAQCLQSRSADCLSTVDQAGSPIEEIDQVVIDNSSDAESFDQEDFSELSGLKLVQQLGNSAILQTGDKNATAILIIRNSETWMLRDLIPAR